jgi:beta-1,4-mannosyl-glycoprotein beta-1,4-N-acetylglucosaminyltransferase
MKVIDCFTFFNELDLLEFRLRLLDESVDLFVIAESDLTHSGNPKPYHFRENEKRFEKWKNRIRYLPVHQTTDGLDFETDGTSYNPAGASWKLENEQRNALAEISELVGDNDLVLLGDLDEIPDPDIFKRISAIEQPVVLSMLFHYYYMNCQNTGKERWWNGTIAVKGEQFRRMKPQHLRDQRNDLPAVKKGGWHFSYLGGTERIKLKIRSFAHTEFNKDEYTSDMNILTAITKGEDIFKRPGVSYKFRSLYFYPPHLRRIMEQYPAFIYRENKPGRWQKLYYSIKRWFT